ncbi:MAG TPA: hypothetical protein VJU16_03450 [Planctomycetota bacterium]|nr:hypothetical protein [Planctomycetota bacterium]
MVTILMAALLAQQAAPIDYSKIERKILREPTYVGKPQYALFLLDEKGDFRVWAVLDRTTPEMTHPNVLYLDLNANGDITEKGERFVTSRDEESMKERGSTISVPAIRVRGLDLMHEEFTVTSYRRDTTVGIYFKLKWAGREPMAGAYGLSGTSPVPWGATAAEARIFHPNPHGPLSFALWGDPVLQLGQDNNVNLFAGNPGSGGSYSVVSDKFLRAGKDRIFVTVVAKDGAGKEVRLRTEILGRC